MDDEKVSLDELVNIVPLDTSTKELAQKVIDEQDLDKTKDLLNLFNLNMAKKNVLRIMKLNNLLDMISDNAIERFEKRSDEFSNKDLLDFMQVTQLAIERAQKNLNLVDETPAIVINNQTNQLNIDSSDSLSRESKAKISAAIQAILKNYGELPTETVEILEENKEEQDLGDNDNNA